MSDDKRVISLSTSDVLQLVCRSLNIEGEVTANFMVRLTLADGKEILLNPGQHPTCFNGDLNSVAIQVMGMVIEEYRTKHQVMEDEEKKIIQALEFGHQHQTEKYFSDLSKAQEREDLKGILADVQEEYKPNPYVDNKIDSTTIDTILDKINAEGIDSLSTKELEILNKGEDE